VLLGLLPIAALVLGVLSCPSLLSLTCSVFATLGGLALAHRLGGALTTRYT